MIVVFLNDHAVYVACNFFDSQIAHSYLERALSNIPLLVVRSPTQSIINNSQIIQVVTQLESGSYFIQIWWGSEMINNKKLEQCQTRGLFLVNLVNSLFSYVRVEDNNVVFLNNQINFA